VERGYGTPPRAGEVSPHPFLPLYPLLARGVSAAGLDPFQALLMVALAAFLGAGLLFALEGRRRLGERGAFRSLLFLLTFPTAFFLVSAYSESLFLLLALAAFRAVAGGRVGVAALLSFLAGATRVPALALAPALAIAAWEIERRDGRHSRRAAVLRSTALGLAVVAGVAAGAVGPGLAAGQPAAYLLAQQAWQRESPSLDGPARFLGTLTEHLSRGDWRTRPWFLLDYGQALLFAGIAVFQARRRRFADAVWTAGALLLPIATGVALSLSRYLLVVFPAFFALAEATEGRPRLAKLWWFVSGALLLAGTAAFVRWRWVA